MSNSCGGGSVLGAGEFVVAVGMMWIVMFQSLDIHIASHVVVVDVDVVYTSRLEGREVGTQKGSDLQIRTKTTSTSFLRCFNRFS